LRGRSANSHALRRCAQPRRDHHARSRAPMTRASTSSGNAANTGAVRAVVAHRDFFGLAQLAAWARVGRRHVPAVFFRAISQWLLDLPATERTSLHRHVDFYSSMRTLLV
jgi:hypothetical protein